MKNNKKLTIILTIAGREIFTQRWLKYMNDICCPYKILIGDNGDDPFFDDLNGLAKCYPQLDINYIRYNSNVSMKSYYTKLESLVSMVHTEYVLFADNDDFNLLDNFENYIDFLDTNPDYVSSRGSAAKFYICSHFGNKSLNLVEGEKYIAFNVTNISIEQLDALERVMWFLSNIEIADVFFNWYSISRTNKVKEILNILNIEDEIDPFLHELMFLVLLINSGKIKIFNELAFLRQEGTSQNLATLISKNPHPFRRIFIENKWQSLYNILDQIFIDKVDNLAIRTSMSKQFEGQILRHSKRLNIKKRIIDKIKVISPTCYDILYNINVYIDLVFLKEKYIKPSVLDQYVISSKTPAN